MACCFRPPATSDSEPRPDYARAQKRAPGNLEKSTSLNHHRASEVTSSKPHAPKASEEASANGKQPPVDRESPVSVLSGPGDDVSSDQRKPCELESGAKDAAHDSQQHQQQQQQGQAQQQKPKLPRQHSNEGGKPPQEEQGKGAKAGAKLPPRTPEELLGIASHMMMDASGPRGFSEPHVLPGSMDFMHRRKSGEPPPQLPGIRAASPLPSQRLHLQRDREQVLAMRQQQQHGQGQSGHQPLDHFEKQRLKQQLLQQQGQAQRSGSAGAGPGSSYASALPGKARILAWLDESDLSYATVHEADNTPGLVKGDLSPLAFGKFLSSLKMGSYEDLAGAAVTRDVLIKRGMQRAQLLPDSAEASGGVPDEGRSPLREHPSGIPPLAGRPSRPPVPSASTATSAGAVAGSAVGASEGVTSGMQANAGVSEEASLGVRGVPGSGREASPVMQGLLSKTAAMLRQRSLGAEDGTARLAGIAAGMDAAEGEEWDRVRPGKDMGRGGTPAEVRDGGGQLPGPDREGRSSEDLPEKGAAGAGTLRPPPPSAPISPDHRMHIKGRIPEHLSGPLGSWAAVSSPAPGMSPALGMAGSGTDAGSRGRAGTNDALSELGGDSTGECPDGSN